MEIETPFRIEPSILTNPSSEIVDLVASLSSASEKLNQKLHPRTASSLADLVRIMNCYYSNLIEGHNTTPREIEQALNGQLIDVPEKRNLQIEAAAHIRIQKLIDEQYESGILPEPCSTSFLRWLHKEFYAEVPASFLKIKGSGDRIITMLPGEFRSKPDEDVTVGRHLPPSSVYIESFMNYFQEKYTIEKLGMGSRIIIMAAAHHRLNYIHPFLDGNGRVSRLMSHAIGLKAGIGAHGLWSISRGLARGLESRQEYKNMMDRADFPRQGDLDGRGNLSLKSFEEFIIWFLQVCLDQVKFMGSLFGIESLSERLKRYQEMMGWKTEVYYLLSAILTRGELSRGDAIRMTGLKERSARTLLSMLLEAGLLSSDTPKSPVYLKFPIDAVDVLFPRFYIQEFPLVIG